MQSNIRGIAPNSPSHKSHPTGHMDKNETDSQMGIWKAENYRRGHSDRDNYIDRCETQRCDSNFGRYPH